MNLVHSPILKSNPIVWHGRDRLDDHLARSPESDKSELRQNKKTQSLHLDKGRLRDRSPVQLSNVTDSLAVTKKGTTTYSFSESFDVQISAEGRRLSYESSTEYSFTSNPVIDVTPVVEAEIPRSSQGPEESSENILNLVGAHLDRLTSDDTTRQELETAADKELKAYIKGRDEAIATLELMGLYDDAIRGGIEKTTELVVQGIEALKRDVTPVGPDSLMNKDSKQTDSVAAGVPSKTDNTSSKTEVVLKRAETVVETKSARAKKNSHVSYVQERLLNKQTINLQIETKDGDIITLMLNEMQGIERQQSTGRGHGRHHHGADSETSQRTTTDFNVIVNGELDKGELEALSSLIDQVSTLASVFQSGNDAAAFELAQNLDLGASELMSMSLDIRNTTKASVTYERVGSYGKGHGHHHGGHHKGLVDLAGYMGVLNGALETAAQFGQPKELLSDLFSTYLVKLESKSAAQFPVSLSQLLDTNDRILESLSI